MRPARSGFGVRSECAVLVPCGHRQSEEFSKESNTTLALLWLNRFPRHQDTHHDTGFVPNHRMLDTALSTFSFPQNMRHIAHELMACVRSQFHAVDSQLIDIRQILFFFKRMTPRSRSSYMFYLSDPVRTNSVITLMYMLCLQSIV